VVKEADMDKIKSLVEARREFATQERCEAYLETMRWPDGVECPRCRSHEVTRLSTRKKWQCKGCRYQFSVTAGTIFHKTYVDLPRWMMALWLMCHSPKGVSSAQIQRDLGVTYKTAWYMTHRIRKAMIADRSEVKLSGIIEMDDAIVNADGGRAKGRLTPHCKHVLGMASRDGDIRLQIVNTLTHAEIKRVFAKNVDYVQAIYTDGHTSFRGLEELAPHRYVVHLEQWVDGDVHTNYVENAWSLFKRALTGIFHHVSAKYLQAYLDEFSFRYSHRDEKPRLMELVLASC
jgi:transposase-like protein